MDEIQIPVYGLTKLNEAGDYALTVNDGRRMAIKNNYLTSIVWNITQELHAHGFWEICLVLKGASLHRFRGHPPREMRAGSIYLLRPHDVHCISPVQPDEAESAEESSYTHRDIYVPCEKMERICNALQDGLLTKLLSLDAPLSATLSSAETNRLESLLNSYAGKEKDFDRMHSIVVSHIVCLLLENMEYNRSEFPEWINELLANLNREDFMIGSIKEIIDSVGYNQSYICRQFKKYTGQTLTDYIRFRKCSYSTSLLSDLNIPLAKIAHRLNFADQSAYTRFFKSFYRITPGQWRKRLFVEKK